MQCVATNLLGNASSQLTSFDFNSFANFNGSRFAAGDDGLYEICCGDTDAGAAISAYILTGLSDFGIQQHKRLRFIYLGIELSAGSLQVTVTADERTVRTYTVTSTVTGQQRIRVPVGRDIYGRYWSFKIANVSGKYFAVDRVEVLPVVRHSGHQ